MMKLKTAILLIITVVISLLFLEYLEKTDPIEPGEVSKTDPTHTFYWEVRFNPIYNFYQTYDQNPSVQYMLSKKWMGIDGSNVELDIVFRRSTVNENYTYLKNPVSAPVGLDITDISKNTIGMAACH